MLQHILNPAFLHSFEKGEGEQLLGPPNPEGDNPDSITSVFITKVHICRQPPKQLQSELPVFLFPIPWQLSLNAFSIFSVLISDRLSTFSVSIIFILFSLSFYLQFLPHALLLTVVVSFRLFPFFIASSICVFFLPPTIPLIPLFVTFHSSDQALIPDVNVRVRPC